ncbi:MAG TPA: hypothetical protein PLM89_08310, partial [Anaerolineales bacterium]|nr:hypothetical protein [Anaerolineales bacterium]
DKLISSLGKRTFILHNVHSKAPELFQTRWVMNFLAGPLMRTQIPALNRLANADASFQTLSQPASVSPSGASQANFAASVPQAQPAESVSQSSFTKPVIPQTIREYYIPQSLSLPDAFKAANRPIPAQAAIEDVIYKPALLASAQIRILDRKLGIDSEIARSALIVSPDKRGMVRWEDHAASGKLKSGVEMSPAPSAKFNMIDAPLNDVKLMSALQKDFSEWAFRNSSVTVRANQALKVFAGPDMTQAEFMTACADAARSERDAEIEKAAAAIDKKLKTVQDKLFREERELRQDQENLRNRNLETGIHGAEVVASLFGLGRKKSLSTPVSKYRMAQKAKEDVRESEEAIVQYKNEIADLEKQREAVAAEISERWSGIVSQTQEVVVAPKKTDVYVDAFGVGWAPYYRVATDGGAIELPAFEMR